MPLRSCSGRLVTVPPHGTCSSRFATESRERRNRLLRISEMLPRKAGLVHLPPFFGQVFITTGCPEQSASRSGTCTRSAGFSAAAGLSPTRPTAPRPPSSRGLLGCTHLFWPGLASHRCGSSARSGGLGLTGGGGAAWCTDMACGLSFQERRLRCARRWGSSCHVRHPPGGRRSIRMRERPTRPPGASFKTRGLLMVSGVIRGHF